MRSTAPLSFNPLLTDTIDIAYVTPFQGNTGIWGPSSQAAAELAVHELNVGGGIFGKKVRLIPIDAERDETVVAREVSALVATGGIDAITGTHNSAIRRAIERHVGGRVPYVYPVAFEGGALGPGVFAIGERPDNQIIPAVQWLALNRSARRWAIVGNDYVFPREVARQVSRTIVDDRLALVHNSFQPIGTRDWSADLLAIERSGADAVLLNLVGGQLLEFNRQFAQWGLDRDVIRVSALLEENLLLAAPDANRNSYAVAGYFDSLPTVASRGVAHRYYERLGADAPPLNGMGESNYEAIRMLAAFARTAGSLDSRAVMAISRPVEVDGAREGMTLVGNTARQHVYIARAEGFEFSIEALLPQPLGVSAASGQRQM